MPRVLLLVLDSVGIGNAPDASQYGDEGADTVGNIAIACAEGRANREGLRAGPLQLPHLVRLGLGEAIMLAGGRCPPGLASTGPPLASFGYAAELSRGKDTPSGHWEIAGLPVPFDWGYFPRTTPCFPSALIEELCRRVGLRGILGNCHASGTEIIARLGEEHRRTGKPICYTSADSVFQIAAHESDFGLNRLYSVCETARELVDPLRIGRVIARPFAGSGSGDFRRTGNRRDFATPPPSPTLLDNASAAGRDVISIGKIGDIFAHSGTGRIVKAEGNDALFSATLAAANGLANGGLLFANLIDFDMLYGHRRDVAGYAAALEAFDRRLPELLSILRLDDLLIITADHGCDPTWTGSDHTREMVPVLAYIPSCSGVSLGRRNSFADIAASCAAHLALPTMKHGQSFLSELR
jgi:phosphopentomutase